MKLSISIPIFDESSDVATVVEQAQGLPLDLEIVLVDVGSVDCTGEIVG